MEAQIMQFPTPAHANDATIDAQIKRLEQLLSAYRKRKMMEAKASVFGMLGDEED